MSLFQAFSFICDGKKFIEYCIFTNKLTIYYLDVKKEIIYIRGGATKIEIEGECRENSMVNKSKYLDVSDLDLCRFLLEDLKLSLFQSGFSQLEIDETINFLDRAMEQCRINKQKKLKNLAFNSASSDGVAV